MKFKTVLLAVATAASCCGSCTNPTKPTPVTPVSESSTKNESNMKSYISIFEIPATDISRAVTFYEDLLGLNIEKMEMGGMNMGIFPFEGQIVPGVIVQAEGYKPSADGVTIYLNGGEDLQIILDRVEKSGGKVLTAKTPHADGNGYFATFLDSEGNKMGLNSPN